MSRLRSTAAVRSHSTWHRSVVLRVAIGLLLVAAAQAIFGPVVIAQEFRIYTRVSQQMETAGAASEPEVVSRSLTLFHVGKAYDYIESVREVIIFEPAHKRFTILSTTRSMATEVKFNELQAKLNMFGKEFGNVIAQPEAQGGPSPKVAKALAFQMAPTFKIAQQPSGNSLSLTSPHITYTAKCSTPKQPQALSSYLRYADWTCKLNYVLHPQTLYPASRLKLNEALRAKEMMPVEVNLAIAGENPMQFKAEHEIHWQLDSKDRSYINDWERMLKDRKHATGQFSRIPAGDARQLVEAVSLTGVS